MHQNHICYDKKHSTNPFKRKKKQPETCYTTCTLTTFKLDLSVTLTQYRGDEVPLCCKLYVESRYSRSVSCCCRSACSSIQNNIDLSQNAIHFVVEVYIYICAFCGRLNTSQALPTTVFVSVYLAVMFCTF